MNNCKVQCLQNNNQFCPNNTLCDDLPMSKCTRINDEMHCCCDDTTPGPTPGPINKGCLTGSLSLFECNESGFRLVNNDGSFDGTMSRRYICDPSNQNCTPNSNYYCRNYNAPIIINAGGWYKPNTILKGKKITKFEDRGATHPGGSNLFAAELGEDTGLKVLVKNVSKGGRLEVEGQLLPGELVVLHPGNTTVMEQIALVCLDTPSGPIKHSTISCFSEDFGNVFLNTAIVRDQSMKIDNNMHDKVAYWSTEEDDNKNIVGLLGECDGKEFLYPIENPLYTLEDRDSIRFNNNHLWCGI